MIPKEEVKRAEQAAAELQSSVTSVQNLRLAEFWYEYELTQALSLWRSG